MAGQRSGDDPGPAAEISVVAGGEFDVVLADLPGAGYRWQLQSVPDGIEALPVEHEVAEPDLLGGSERSAHRYRATLPGTYELVFDLVRPWEAAAPAGAPPGAGHRVGARIRGTEPEEIAGPPDSPGSRRRIILKEGHCRADVGRRTCGTREQPGYWSWLLRPWSLRAAAPVTMRPGQ